MAITVASGFPTQAHGNGGTGITTLSVTPVTVGDVMVMITRISSTTITVNTVSGGGVSSWQRAGTTFVDSTNTYSYEIWWGVVGTTGASTITLTWSSGNTLAGDMIAIELNSGLAYTQWAITGTGTANNASSLVVTFPAITSNALALQAYFGYMVSLNTAVAGSTPGFSWSINSNGNPLTWNPALSPSTGYTPSTTQSPAGTSSGIAVIVSGVAPPKVPRVSLPQRQ